MVARVEALPVGRGAAEDARLEERQGRRREGDAAQPLARHEAQERV